MNPNDTVKIFKRIFSKKKFIKLKLIQHKVYSDAPPFGNSIKDGIQNN